MFCLKKDVLKTAWNNISSLFLIAFFTTTVPSLLRAYAMWLGTISPTRLDFWGTFEPFITAGYMYILFDKKLTKKQALGCCIGVSSGIFFTIMQSFKNEMSFPTYFFLCLADIAQIGSILIARYGWIRIQGLLQKNILTPSQMNGFAHTISGFLALILGYFVFGETFDYSKLLEPKLFNLMVYTVIVGNMIAYTLVAKLIKNQSATFVALAGLSVPLFVHLGEVVFFGKPFSWIFFVSAGLMFIALRLFYGNKKVS